SSDRGIQLTSRMAGPRKRRAKQATGPNADANRDAGISWDDSFSLADEIGAYNHRRRFDRSGYQWEYLSGILTLHVSGESLHANPAPYLFAIACTAWYVLR